MLKLGRPLSLAIFLVMMLSGCARSTLTPEQAAQMNATAQSYVISVQAQLSAEASAATVAFIGDSYTVGTGASDKSKRWTTLVSAVQGWTEVNLGRGGTGYLTTAGVAGCGEAFCPNYDAMVAEAAKMVPGKIVVAGGQNDFSVSLEVMRPQIEKTYQDLRAALPNAEIIAVGPTIIGDVTPYITAFDAMVQTAAKSVGARYVSMINPDAISSDMSAPDGVHVNDSGHRAIADRVLSALSA